MEDIEKLGENASEMINKLSRQLEHARDLNDLFSRFINVDDLDLPSEIKDLIKEKYRFAGMIKQNDFYENQGVGSY